MKYFVSMLAIATALAAAAPAFAGPDNQADCRPPAAPGTPKAILARSKAALSGGPDAARRIAFEVFER